MRICHGKNVAESFVKKKSLFNSAVYKCDIQSGEK
jgi:hypothetical protein